VTAARPAARPGDTADTPEPDIEASGGRAQLLVARDGLKLRIASWQPPGATRDIVLLGGRSEFIEKFLETIGELVQRGFRVWTFDWRGQGLSGRELSDPLKGHIERYETYLDDLDLFLGAVVRRTATGPLIVLANSMGGHIVLRYMHDHPDAFERAVLTAPMFDIMTGFYPAGIARGYAAVACWLGLGDHFIPGGGEWDRATLPFYDNKLTSDHDRFQDEVGWLARRPALAVGGPTYAWVHATFVSIDLCRNPAYVSSIGAPILVVSASDERIVRNDIQVMLSGAMPRCRRIELAGARHEILKETDEIRGRFWNEFDAFVGMQPAPAGSARPRGNAAETGSALSTVRSPA